MGNYTAIVYMTNAKEAESPVSPAQKPALTPNMVRAGVYALFDLGGPEDLLATSPEQVVRDVFLANAEHAAEATQTAEEEARAEARAQVEGHEMKFWRLWVVRFVARNRLRVVMGDR